MRTQNLIVTLMLGGCLALLGCGGGGGEDIQPEIIPGNEGGAGGGAMGEMPEETEAPEEAVEEDDDEEYTYDPIGKRDPFKSLVVDDLGNQPKPRTPLQRYDIDQLKVVGIIWGISNPKAMVQAPDGKGYVVGKGTPIGKTRGKVTRITQREVVISEEYRDFEGKLLVNETALKIKEER